MAFRAGPKEGGSLPAGWKRRPQVLCFFVRLRNCGAEACVSQTWARPQGLADSPRAGRRAVMGEWL